MMSDVIIDHWIVIEFTGSSVPKASDNVSGNVKWDAVEKYISFVSAALKSQKAVYY